LNGSDIRVLVRRARAPHMQGPRPPRPRGPLSLNRLRRLPG
jgi:hypothetical protein